MTENFNLWKLLFQQFLCNHLISIELFIQELFYHMFFHNEYTSPFLQAHFSKWAHCLDSGAQEIWWPQILEPSVHHFNGPEGKIKCKQT